MKKSQVYGIAAAALTLAACTGYVSAFTVNPSGAEVWRIIGYRVAASLVILLHITAAYLAYRARFYFYLTLTLPFLIASSLYILSTPDASPAPAIACLAVVAYIALAATAKFAPKHPAGVVLAVVACGLFAGLYVTVYGVAQAVSYVAVAAIVAAHLLLIYMVYVGRSTPVLALTVPFLIASIVYLAMFIAVAPNLVAACIMVVLYLAGIVLVALNPEVVVL